MTSPTIHSLPPDSRLLNSPSFQFESIRLSALGNASQLRSAQERDCRETTAAGRAGLDISRSHAQKDLEMLLEHLRYSRAQAAERRKGVRMIAAVGVPPAVSLSVHVRKSHRDTRRAAVVLTGLTTATWGSGEVGVWVRDRLIREVKKSVGQVDKDE